MSVDEAVSQASSTVHDAASLATMAVELAEKAKNAHTIAVGAVLVDSTGKMWQAMHNNVVVDGEVADPTAHAELQLITWYHKQRFAGEELPRPSEMTIVTSLDPCLMCTGAVLVAGMNVIAVTNDTRLGASRDLQASNLSDTLKHSILRQFAYYGVDDGYRAFTGSSTSSFHEAVVSRQLEKKSAELFSDSSAYVTNLMLEQERMPSHLIRLRDDSPQLQLLRQYYPAAGDMAVDLENPADKIRLLRKMLHVAKDSKKNGGSYGAAAVIDSFDNVLLILGSSPTAQTPIETPLTRVCRAYAACRHGGLSAGSLPHPKRCTFVLLYGPTPTAKGLLDLGVYGVTLGPSQKLHPLYYFYASQDDAALGSMVRSLPPLFRHKIYFAHLSTLV